MTPCAADPATLESLESMNDSQLALFAPTAEAILLLAEDVKRIVIADLARAERLSGVLVTVADRAGFPAGRARTRSARAHVLAGANRLTEAAALCEEAVTIASAHGCTFEVAAAKLSSVQPLSRSGYAGEALAAAEEAASLFMSLNQPTWAAKAEVNAGVIHKLRDQYEAALGCFDRAAGSFAEVPAVLAQVESNRAEALLELNRFGDARAAFSRAIDCFARTGNRRGEAIVRGNLADLHLRLGNYDAALHDYELALREYERYPSPGDLARLHAERAEVLASLGMTRNAAAAFEEAIPKLRAYALFWELARATLAHARVLLKLKRHAECGTFLEQSAAAFESLKHKSGLAQVSVTRALLAAQSGVSPGVIDSLRSAAHQLRDRPAESVLIRLALHSVWLIQNSTDDSGSLDTLVSDAEVLGIAPLLADALRIRASYSMRQGRSRAALGDLLRAMDLIERVRGSLRSQELRAAFLGDRHGVYEEAVDAALRGGVGAASEFAFEVVQRARARTFLDVLHGADTTAESAGTMDGGAEDSSTPLFREHRELRHELHALYTQLTAPRKADSTAAQSTKLRRAIADIERRTDAVELRLGSLVEFNDLYAAPCDAGQVGRGLGARTVLLDLFAVRDEMFAFVVRADRPIEVVSLGSVSRITERASQFGFHVSRELARASAGAMLRGHRSQTVVTDTLQRLGDAVLGPIHDLIRGCKSIRIVPHGPLHEVPFEALEYDGAPLIERMSVAYAPSASTLTKLAPLGTGLAPRRALVFGVPDDLAPHIEREANAVAEAVEARPVIGAGATFGAFAEAAAGAGIIHLAMHAVGSHDSQMSARLQFADRWVSAREIARLKLPGSLVVLSGCETGRGTLLGCDDTFGLVRAFVVAGARGLLVTRWPVHDAAACDLMIQTYRRSNIHAARFIESFADAMRDSQVQAARADVHPALWAPFMLIGSP